MPHLKEMAVQKLNEMSPMWLAIYLMGFGVLSGGGGTILAGNLLGFPQTTVVTTAQFDATLTELNSTMRQINENLSGQRALLLNTRCEIRMLRDDGDWRDCWLPEEERQ